MWAAVLFYVRCLQYVQQSRSSFSLAVAGFSVELSLGRACHGRYDSLQCNANRKRENKDQKLG